MAGAISRGEHNRLWEMILSAAQNSINEDSIRGMLIDAVNGKIKEYKNEGIFKKLFVSIGEIIGGIEAGSVANKIINAVNEFIDEAKNNTSHPARQNLIIPSSNSRKGSPAAISMLMR